MAYYHSQRFFHSKSLPSRYSLFIIFAFYLPNLLFFALESLEARLKLYHSLKIFRARIRILKLSFTLRHLEKDSTTSKDVVLSFCADDLLSLSTGPIMKGIDL